MNVQMSLLSTPCTLHRLDGELDNSSGRIESSDNSGRTSPRYCAISVQVKLGKWNKITPWCKHFWQGSGKHCYELSHTASHSVRQRGWKHKERVSGPKSAKSKKRWKTGAHCCTHCCVTFKQQKKGLLQGNSWRIQVLHTPWLPQRESLPPLET